MRLKYALYSAVTASILVTGCANVNSVGTKGTNNSWNSSQREEFINILEQDKYSSMCNLHGIYAQYKKTKDDNILTKLLVSYTENLANSCIETESFKSSISSNSNANYEFYKEYVGSSDIESKIGSGATISSILEPYVPSMPQFYPLVQAYDSAVSPVQKYKIKQNIERIKLLKPDNWNTYVMVNIPEYKFRLFENGQNNLEFNVITGRPTWPTPVFTLNSKLF